MILEISTNIFTIVDISTNKIKYKGYYSNNQRNGNGKTFYENGNIRYDVNGKIIKEMVMVKPIMKMELFIMMVNGPMINALVIV